MPVQATAVTRLGIDGGIWNRLGGDYSNKASAPISITVSQSEAGDANTASLKVIIQLTVSLSEAGDVTTASLIDPSIVVGSKKIKWIGTM